MSVPHDSIAVFLWPIARWMSGILSQNLARPSYILTTTRAALGPPRACNGAGAEAHLSPSHAGWRRRGACPPRADALRLKRQSPGRRVSRLWAGQGFINVTLDGPEHPPLGLHANLKLKSQVVPTLRLQANRPSLPCQASSFAGAAPRRVAPGSPGAARSPRSSIRTGPATSRSRRAGTTGPRGSTAANSSGRPRSPTLRGGLPRGRRAVLPPA